MNEMKILLINSEKEESGYLPLATAYLAGYLKEQGYDNVKIIDRTLTNDVVEEIKEYNPNLIGMNVFSCLCFEMKQLAKKIKKVMDVPIVAGGPHIYCDPLNNLKGFDIGVTGEGEVTLLELVKLLESKGKFEVEDLRKINGLVFFNEGKTELTPQREYIEDIDTIPFPTLDLLDMKHYSTPGEAGVNFIGRRGYLLTSRGCPYNCTYCASSCIWSSVRWHSAERTVAEIKNWVGKYKANHFLVYDDLFIANLPRLEKMINLLEKENLLGKIDFEILARANLITERACILLKKLNATTVSVGFESGSPKILKYLKGTTVTVEHGKKAIDLLDKYGFATYGLFMIGSPGETEEDLKMTYEMVKDPKIKVLNVNVTMPFPGTVLWHDALRDKIYPPDFYEKGISVSPTKPNFDYLMTKEISKEKFEEYFNKFTKLIEKKEREYKTIFKPTDIKFFFSYRFLKKLVKKREIVKQKLANSLRFVKSVSGGTKE